MAHDVFICHAHKDRRVADVICEKLERAQVRCWIAERDISVGEDRTEATRNAIGSSRVMVVVLSENANAAPHIEREIAHAFYTKRTIIPLRLTDTLPRRDFLFYLGNIRGFDAFTPSADQHLEALTENINGIVRGRPAVRNAGPLSAIKTPATLNSPNSWIGGIRASHYRTLELLKRAAIAAILAAIVWLLWLVTRPAEYGPSPSENGQRWTTSGRGVSSNSLPNAVPRVPESTPIPTPTYTYSRFGLWVAPSAAPSEAPTPPAQGSQQSPKARSEAESTRVRDGANAPSGKRAPTQKSKRRERHREKSRPKRRAGKTSAFEDIQSGLRSFWRKIGAASKDPGNR